MRIFFYFLLFGLYGLCGEPLFAFAPKSYTVISPFPRMEEIEIWGSQAAALSEEKRGLVSLTETVTVSSDEVRLAPNHQGRSVLQVVGEDPIDISCAYCQVFLRGVPNPVTVRGKRLVVRAWSVPMLRVEGIRVEVLEAVAVGTFAVTANDVRFVSGLFAMNQMHVSADRCSVAGGMVEIWEQGMWQCRNTEWDLGRLFANRWEMIGDRSHMILADGRVYRWNMTLNEITMHLGKSMHVMRWAGHVGKWTLSTSTLLPALFEALAGGSPQFVRESPSLQKGPETTSTTPPQLVVQEGYVRVEKAPQSADNGGDENETRE